MSIDPEKDAIEHENKLSRESNELLAEIEFHKDNWLDAVTKSPQESHGDFGNKCSIEILSEHILETDIFLVAEILIKLYNSGNKEVKQLFEDMAEYYAEAKVLN